jgi:hypothetical protein
MQVRQILVAALLAAGAAGAMSQEIDPSETLQARNLAAQQVQAAQGRESAAVVAQARVAETGGQPEAVERADVKIVGAATKLSWAQRHATHTYAKAWLHADRKQPRPLAVIDLG